jgi:hypothetical protein
MSNQYGYGNQPPNYTPEQQQWMMQQQFGSSGYGYSQVASALFTIDKLLNPF